jgi:hypothetical protein
MIKLTVLAGSGSIILAAIRHWQPGSRSARMR